MVKSWVITGVCLIGAGVLCCTAAIGAGALNQQRYREKLHLTDRRTHRRKIHRHSGGAEGCRSHRTNRRIGVCGGGEHLGRLL